jgi:hypothetical protein
MGWSNYIIIPSLKLKIEINRNIEEGVAYPDLPDEPYCDIHKPLKSTTLSDIGDLVSYYKKVPYIEYKDELLIIWLNYRGIKYIILSEADKRLEQYKGYNILNII